jgi:hypothetical protein
VELARTLLQVMVLMEDLVEVLAITEQGLVVLEQLTKDLVEDPLVPHPLHTELVVVVVLVEAVSQEIHQLGLEEMVELEYPHQ